MDSGTGGSTGNPNARKHGNFGQIDKAAVLSLITTHLGQFPNIIRFLTNRDIHRMVYGKDTPLLQLLRKSAGLEETGAQGGQRPPPAKAADGHPVALYAMDRLLGCVGRDHRRSIKSAILHKDFYKLLTQLLVHQQLEKEYGARLEPKVCGGHRLDIRVKIGNFPCYFELYRPEGEKDGTKTAGIGKRAVDKFDRQLAATESLRSPVILVIDTQNFDINDTTARAMIDEILRLVPVIGDRPRTRPPLARTGHPPDGYFKHWNLLSAVILLRCRTGGTARDIELEEVATHRNDNARFPIPDDVLEGLRQALFGP